MLKIRPLNRESLSDEDAPVLRKEIQEEIALDSYNKALRIQSSGDLNEAEEILQKLINENIPNLESQGGLPKSMSTLKYSCYLNLGHVFLKKGDVAKALENYLEASELDGTDVTLWHKIGKLAMKQNEFHQAIYAFSKGLNYNENHWPCLDEIISVLFAVRDTIGCLMYIGKALILDPDYTKGLVLRRQIYRDNPATKEYYQKFNPEHTWEPPLDVKIDSEDEDECLKEVETIRERVREVEKAMEPKPLSTIPLPKPLEEYSWVSFGRTVTELHKYIADNHMSHFTFVDMSKCMSQSGDIKEIKTEVTEKPVEEKLEDVKPPENKVVPKEDEEMETEPVMERRFSITSEENATPSQTDVDEEQGMEQDNDDQDETVENKADKTKGTNKGNKRKRDLLSDLQIWGWHSKRKYARKTKDYTVEDALNRILPPTLLRNKIGSEKFNQDEDSMNTMDIYNMFLEDKHMNILSPIHSPKSINYEPYFGTDREKDSVRSIWLKKREYCDAIVLIRDFVINLSKYWHVKWPKDLVTLYLDAYLMYREHFDLPNPYSNENPFEEIRDEALATLTYGELLTFNILSSSHFEEKPLHVSLLTFLQVAANWVEDWKDEYTSFFLRVYWLRAYIFRKESSNDLAVRALQLVEDAISEEEEKTGEKYFLTLPNCTKCGMISVDVTSRILKHLDMIDSLSCLEDLYNKEEYRKVSEIIKSTFNSPGKSPTFGRMGRPAQIAMLLHSLWFTDFDDCFVWSEEGLAEAVPHFIKPAKDAYKWEKIIEKCLAIMHEIIKKNTAEVVNRLSDNKRARLVENLSKIICRQINSEAITHIPLNSVTPWIILHYILLKNEEKFNSSRDSESKEENDLENVPASLAILFSAHDFLGPKSWCLTSQGELLHFMLDVLLEREDSLLFKYERWREKIDIQIEQALFCLYQHPSKKNKISRHLADHNVNPLPLTWQKAFQLYEFYAPDSLPEFNSYRNASITSDIEQLLLRITALVPTECDPSPLIPKMQEYLQGKTDKLPEPIEFPNKVRAIYYLLGDYYFKQREFVRCVKYFLMDLVINPWRVDSWACLGLSYFSQLENKLNFCKNIKSEDEFLERAKCAQIGFKKALSLSNEDITLWIEFGSFEYMAHSFCSRYLKYESENLSMERFEYLENQKESFLESSGQSFEKAIALYEMGDNEPDERWLQYYILGKIAEKKQKEPSEYLNYYLTASNLLHENNATYPDKILYNNPQHLSIEALELHYRMNASIIKYLELHEGKEISNAIGNLFKRSLDALPINRKLVQEKAQKRIEKARLAQLEKDKKAAEKQLAENQPQQSSQVAEPIKNTIGDILAEKEKQSTNGKAPLDVPQLAAEQSSGRVIQSRPSVIKCVSDEKIEPPKPAVDEAAVKQCLEDLLIQVELLSDKSQEEVQSAVEGILEEIPPNEANLAETLEIGMEVTEESGKTEEAKKTEDVILLDDDDDVIILTDSDDETGLKKENISFNKLKSLEQSEQSKNLNDSASDVLIDLSPNTPIPKPKTLPPESSACRDLSFDLPEETSKIHEQENLSDVLEEMQKLSDSMIQAVENPPQMITSTPIKEIYQPVTEDIDSLPETPIMNVGNIAVDLTVDNEESSVNEHYTTAFESLNTALRNDEVLHKQDKHETSMEIVEVTENKKEEDKKHTAMETEENSHKMENKSVKEVKDIQQVLDEMMEETMKKAVQTDVDSDTSIMDKSQMFESRDMEEKEGTNNSAKPEKMLVDSRKKENAKDVKKENGKSSGDSSSSESSSSSSYEDSSSGSDSDSEEDSSSSSSSSSSEESTSENMSNNEILHLVDRCMKGLEQCILRLPQNYKALYRLAHLFFYFKSRKDLTKCKQVLLGEYKCSENISVSGLFSERKATNFFNGIWRIPSSEIDRPGSLSAHMSRCITLLLQILRATNDHKVLLELCFQLKRTPDPDKVYIKESERKQFSEQAMSMCIQCLRNQSKNTSNTNNTAMRKLLQDLYRAYIKVQKHKHEKESVFASLLTDAYKKFIKEKIPETANVLELATKFCQQVKLVEKQNITPNPLALRNPLAPNTPVLPSPSALNSGVILPAKKSVPGRPRGRPPLPKNSSQVRQSRGKSPSNATGANWKKRWMDPSFGNEYLKQYQEELMKQYSQSINYNQLNQFRQLYPQNQLSGQSQAQLMASYLTAANALMAQNNLATSSLTTAALQNAFNQLSPSSSKKSTPQTSFRGFNIEQLMASTPSIPKTQSKKSEKSNRPSTQISKSGTFKSPSAALPSTTTEAYAKTSSSKTTTTVASDPFKTPSPVSNSPGPEKSGKTSPNKSASPSLTSPDKGGKSSPSLIKPSPEVKFPANTSYQPVSPSLSVTKVHQETKTTGSTAYKSPSLSVTKVAEKPSHQTFKSSSPATISAVQQDRGGLNLISPGLIITPKVVDVSTRASPKMQQNIQPQVLNMTPAHSNSPPAKALHISPTFVSQEPKIKTIPKKDHARLPQLNIEANISKVISSLPPAPTSKGGVTIGKLPSSISITPTPPTADHKSPKKAHTSTTSTPTIFGIENMLYGTSKIPPPAHSHSGSQIQHPSPPNKHGNVQSQLNPPQIHISSHRSGMQIIPQSTSSAAHVRGVNSQISSARSPAHGSSPIHFSHVPSVQIIPPSHTNRSSSMKPSAIHTSVITSTSVSSNPHVGDVARKSVSFSNVPVYTQSPTMGKSRYVHSPPKTSTSTKYGGHSGLNPRIGHRGGEISSGMEIFKEPVAPLAYQLHPHQPIDSAANFLLKERPSLSVMPVPVVSAPTTSAPLPSYMTSTPNPPPKTLQEKLADKQKQANKQLIRNIEAEIIPRDTMPSNLSIQNSLLASKSTNLSTNASIPFYKVKKTSQQSKAGKSNVLKKSDVAQSRSKATKSVGAELTAHLPVTLSIIPKKSAAEKGKKTPDDDVICLD